MYSGRAAGKARFELGIVAISRGLLVDSSMKDRQYLRLGRHLGYMSGLQGLAVKYDSCKCPGAF